MIKLHLGCGMCKLYNYINIDIRKTPCTDLIANCKKLPYETNTVDEIISYHLIEHFERDEAYSLLNYWKSLLKQNGKLILECPNILGFFKRTLSTYEKTGKLNIAHIFGGQRTTIPNDIHKWGYTQQSIKELLVSLSFRNIKITEGTDYHAKDYEYTHGLFIRAEAIK